MILNQYKCPELRDLFCNAIYEVFNDAETFIDFLENEKYSSSYDCYLDGSGENYIINRITGEYINWYKTYHLGRCIAISTIRKYDTIHQWFNVFLTEFKIDCIIDESKSEELMRKGHWIWNFDKGYCKCSECGIGMGHKEFDYCPNCGAKMQESED